MQAYRGGIGRKRKYYSTGNVFVVFVFRRTTTDKHICGSQSNRQVELRSLLLKFAVFYLFFFFQCETIQKEKTSAFALRFMCIFPYGDKTSIEAVN